MADRPALWAIWMSLSRNRPVGMPETARRKLLPRLPRLPREGRAPMRWIVATSLRFRYLVAGLAVALLYFGVTLAGSQKLDAFPEFAPVSVEIQTNCLGLSPSQIESLTTVPLEAALHGVPGVYDIRSDSEPQLSAIFLYFGKGTDQMHARQLVQERIQVAAHTLPSWCDVPQMYPIVSATSRVMQIGLTSKTVSLTDRSMEAQWQLRPRLMDVPGVANVAIWGEKPKQIMVEADPAKMAKDGVAMSDIMTTASNAVDAGELGYTTGAAVGSLGIVAAANQQVDVHNIQPIAAPQQLARVPLVTAQGKTPYNLGDVADVTWGYPPLIGDAVINGGPGLMLVVEKFPGANTLDVTNGIDKAPRRGPVPVVQGAGLPHALRDQARHVGDRAGPDGVRLAEAGARRARGQDGRQPHRPGAARRGGLRRQLLRDVAVAGARHQLRRDGRPPAVGADGQAARPGRRAARAA
jgi:hypothetical protein